MLFDAHQDLIKRLMREAHVGKRDVDFETVDLGPNKVVRVSAKTEDGVEFIQDLQSRVPTIKVSDYTKRSQVAALRSNPIVVVEEGPDDEDEDLDEEEDLEEDDLEEDDLDEDDLEEEDDEEGDEADEDE